MSNEETGITFDSFKARCAVLDVGRKAERGVPLEELRVMYPALEESDLEVAKQIIRGPRDWSLEGAGVDQTRFRRNPAFEPQVRIWEFDRWVNDNNIPESFEYSKGWWDYVELVRKFAERLDAEEVRVIGHYIVDTPPPCERLPMPAVAITIPNLTIALRYDFGSWSLKHTEISEWVVSIDRRSPYRGPLFGLFDENQDLHSTGADGLAPDFLFGSYRENPSRFSCLIRDEWDVATLLRIVTHEL